MSNVDHLGERLSVILEAEYHALTRGNLKAIERLGQDKLDILEQIGTADAHALSRFEQLRPRLVRNQILAMSAIEGMRAALARAREITAVSDRLRCYGANGKDASVEVSRGKALSKRS